MNEKQKDYTEEHIQIQSTELTITASRCPVRLHILVRTELIPAIAALESTKIRVPNCVMLAHTVSVESGSTWHAILQARNAQELATPHPELLVLHLIGNRMFCFSVLVDENV
jgi:hypothetical protein